MIIFTRWILTGLLALFWYGVFKIVENYAVNWSHLNWSLIP